MHPYQIISYIRVIEFKDIKMRFSILLAVLVAGGLPLINAQVLTLDSTALNVTVVAENLDTPWEILWGPDDHIWLTERKGLVSRIDPVSGEVKVLLDITGIVDETTENGLLGMALHPNFEHPDSPFVYLVYTYFTSTRWERLARYTYDQDTLVDEMVLLDGIPASHYHTGSRVIILPDRTLLMSTGDAGSTSNALDTTSLAGKFLRINLDGSVPDDNPVAGSYIWSYGHRNPQGLVLAPNGMLYSSEHGPSNDDEINIIKKHGNYGWPEVMGFCDLIDEQAFCAANNVVEPLIAWTPTLAVCGLDYYGHDAIPEWKDALLLATLKQDDLRVLKLNAAGDSVISEDIYFNNEYGRLRDICVSPDGDIYFSTSNRDGRGNDGFPQESDDRIIRLSNEQYSVPTSTDESGENSKLRFYPNPAGNTIYLFHEGVQSYRIYDLSSRLIQHGRTEGAIDVSRLHQGIYILETKVDGSIRLGKFLKK